MATSPRTSFRLDNAVAAVASNAAALPLGTEYSGRPSKDTDVRVSTRPLFLTAWMAAALLGRGLHSWVSDADDDDSMSCSFDVNPLRAPERALNLNRFRRVTKKLGLTESQQVAVDRAISRFQPLIAQWRTELGKKQQSLAALQPTSDGFLYNTGRLSNDIGMLATQLAITSSKLKIDIYGILSADQQSLLGELQTAFELYE